MYCWLLFLDSARLRADMKVTLRGLREDLSQRDRTRAVGARFTRDLEQPDD